MVMPQSVPVRFSGATLHVPRGHATKARRNPTEGMTRASVAMAPCPNIKVRQNTSAAWRWPSRPGYGSARKHQLPGQYQPGQYQIESTADSNLSSDVNGCPREARKYQMTARPFTHLHCHSHYSLLDGASSIKKLVDDMFETIVHDSEI